MTLEGLVYIALGVMFVLPGLLAMWVGIRGSKWFFGSHSYSYLVERIGMGWARVVMIIVGLLLLGATVLVVLDPMGVMKGV